MILFTTPSGSCTLRPPRLLLCCFPLHRRQISSDITYSLLSSTATKNTNFERTSTATEQVGVQFSQYIITGTDKNRVASDATTVGGSHSGPFLSQLLRATRPSYYPTVSVQSKYLKLFFSVVQAASSNYIRYTRRKIHIHLRKNPGI